MIFLKVVGDLTSRFSSYWSVATPSIPVDQKVAEAGQQALQNITIQPPIHQPNPQSLHPAPPGGPSLDPHPALVSVPVPVLTSVDSPVAAVGQAALGAGADVLPSSVNIAAAVAVSAGPGPGAGPGPDRGAIHKHFPADFKDNAENQGKKSSGIGLRSIKSHLDDVFKNSNFARAKQNKENFVHWLVYDARLRSIAPHITELGGKVHFGWEPSILNWHYMDDAFRPFYLAGLGTNPPMIFRGESTGRSGHLYTLKKDRENSFNVLYPGKLQNQIDCYEIVHGDNYFKFDDRPVKDIFIDFEREFAGSISEGHLSYFYIPNRDKTGGIFGVHVLDAPLYCQTLYCVDNVPEAGNLREFLFTPIQRPRMNPKPNDARQWNANGLNQVGYIMRYSSKQPFLDRVNQVLYIAGHPCSKGFLVDSPMHSGCPQAILAKQNPIVDVNFAEQRRQAEENAAKDRQFRLGLLRQREEAKRKPAAPRTLQMHPDELRALQVQRQLKDAGAAAAATNG